jgi:ABC-type polysaccharide/polyol phosphate export permease
MLVYTCVALVVFGRGEQYFSAFIFIGYTSYKFFEKTLKSSVKLVKNNKPIIKKVYLPKHILLFSKIYVNGFTTMISYVLVVGAMMIYRVPLTWKVIFCIPLLLLLVLITFGFSTILMHFGVFVDDLSNVINVALRLVFYMSGVFYSLSKRLDSELLVTILLKCNPMAFIIDQLRDVLLYGKTMNFPLYFIWVGISLLLSVLGLRLIYKNENSYVKVV